MSWQGLSFILGVYSPVNPRITTNPHIRAREEAIAIEMVKNLRDQVSWCQRKHPVTHYYDCAELVGKYLKLVRVRSLLNKGSIKL